MRKPERKKDPTYIMSLATFFCRTKTVSVIKSSTWALSYALVVLLKLLSLTKSTISCNTCLWMLNASTNFLATFFSLSLTQNDIKIVKYG